MKTVRYPCGCRAEHGRERWVELCPTHYAEWREFHERAQQDRQQFKINNRQGSSDDGSISRRA